MVNLSWMYYVNKSHLTQVTAFLITIVRGFVMIILRSMVVAFLVFCSAYGQIKVVNRADHAQVVDNKNGYSVEAPRHWYASETNPIPFMFSYPPSDLGKAQIGVPVGGAQISVVSDAGTYNLGSIEKWIASDRKAQGSSIVKVIDTPPNPLLSHVVEVVYYEDVGDSRHEQVINTTKIYFALRGQPYAAVLSFNANDPKARQYQKQLIDTLRSLKEVNK